MKAFLVIAALAILGFLCFIGPNGIAGTKRQYMAPRS
jgi:hypothetical protein